MLLTILSAVALASANDETRFDHPFETDAHREPALQTGGSCVIRGATIHTGRGARLRG